MCQALGRTADDRVAGPHQRGQRLRCGAPARSASPAPSTTARRTAGRRAAGRRRGRRCRPRSHPRRSTSRARGSRRSRDPQLSTIGDRRVGHRLEPGREVLVELVVGQAGEQRLAQRRRVRREATPDGGEQAQLLRRLTLGEVDDVGAVEPAEVHGLVELGHQRVEHRRGEGDDGIAVDVRRPHAHRTNADRQPAGLIALHPAAADQRLHDDVQAALRRLEIAGELGERRRVALGQALEDLHRAHRRLGIALTRPVDHGSSRSSVAGSTP